MKKILVVYGTAGEGHKRAALALKDAFDLLVSRGRDITVEIIDALDYTNRFFRWFYPRSYIFMITYLPTVWGILYYILDIKWLYPLVKTLRRATNRIHGKAFEKFLLEYNADAVIATHFLASEVVSYLERRGKLKTVLVTCVTDFRMHSFWFADQADFYCAGFEEVKKDLTGKWRVAPDKINVTGIPVY
ncbi:MAG: hypothetical protein HY589_04300, partial [Candidatus Omnitrophica bacterium]|nr:hypothetical protein [Candidatus Omnitrophota bacterium]